MRVNHNVSAMNALRLLNVNNTASSKTLEKLSSGKRINRAGDDAAGMAISEKMKAQVNGLKIASRNSLDGVSLVQTAEGAMGEVHSMLQRMRELAVQSANGTMSSNDRQAIQDEVNQLTSEVNRITNGTEYNTRHILKGNEEPKSNTIVQRMTTGDVARVEMTQACDPKTPFTTDLSNKTLTIEVNGKKTEVNLNGFTGATNTTLKGSEFLARINDALGDDAVAIINNGNKIEIRSKLPGGIQNIKVEGTAAITLFGGIKNVTGKAENSGGTSKGSFYIKDVPENKSFIVIGNNNIDFYDSSKAPYVGSNKSIDVYKSGATPTYKTPSDIVMEIVSNVKLDGVKFTKSPANDAELVLEAEDVGFKGNLISLEGTLEGFNTNLQIGANSGQNFRLEVGDIRSRALRISADKPTGNPGVTGAAYVKMPNVTNGVSSSMVEYSLDVSDEKLASAAIEVFNNAIVKVASERSKLGATQNRLEHTIANLDNSGENLTAAMSRIEDTDMAEEMANFQKLNVLQQAGVSMLAQANQQPQSILKLLQG